MIHVTVSQVSFYNNMGFVVLLRGMTDKRTLPIFIGASEAQSIALFLEHVKAPRPLTHDLFKNVMDNLECRMKRVEVCDLNNNTFYAKLCLECNGMESSIDARPSDAIAIALRFSAPIYVEDKVMNTAGVIINESSTGEKQESRQQKKKQSSPVESLKQQIKKAIKDERYEDAARLRDELKAFTQSN